MTTTRQIVHPIVHLNGTGKDTLIEQRTLAYTALRMAVNGLKQMAPNGRDYYPVPGLLEDAVHQHMDRLRVINEIMDDLVAEIDHIEEQ